MNLATRSMASIHAVTMDSSVVQPVTESPATQGRFSTRLRPAQASLETSALWCVTTEGLSSKGVRALPLAVARAAAGWAWGGSGQCAHVGELVRSRLRRQGEGHAALATPWATQ